MFSEVQVNTAVYQEVLEHFMLPAADQLYGDLDFIFQQDLAPAHSAKATSTWFKDHGIPVLNWPANSPDLNPIENGEICIVHAHTFHVHTFSWPRFQKVLSLYWSEVIF